MMDAIRSRVEDLESGLSKLKGNFTSLYDKIDNNNENNIEIITHIRSIKNNILNIEKNIVDINYDSNVLDKMLKYKLSLYENNNEIDSNGQYKYSIDIENFEILEIEIYLFIENADLSLYNFKMYFENNSNVENIVEYEFIKTSNYLYLKAYANYFQSPREYVLENKSQQKIYFTVIHKLHNSYYI